MAQPAARIAAPKQPKQPQRPSRRQRNLANAPAHSVAHGVAHSVAHGPAGGLNAAHATYEAVSGVEVEPPHPPRKETPVYRATHKRLIVTEDRPCFICGVRRSDLLSVARRNDPRVNPYRATAMESHHWPVERSLMLALDTDLLAQAYPTVRQFKTLEEWVDSEFNMLVLCSACHRLAPHAIHRALWQDVIATKFARRNASGARYEFATDAADVAQVEAADDALLAATPATTPAAAPVATPVATPVAPALTDATSSPLVSTTPSASVSPVRGGARPGASAPKAAKAATPPKQPTPTKTSARA